MKSNEYLYGDEEPPPLDQLSIIRRLEILDDRLEEELELPPEKRNKAKIIAIEYEMYLMNKLKERE